MKKWKVLSLKLPIRRYSTMDDTINEFFQSPDSIGWEPVSWKLSQDSDSVLIQLKSFS